jgi:hypothetical protein
MFDICENCNLHVVLLKCGCRLHVQTLDPIEENLSCPICRTPVDMEMVGNIMDFLFCIDMLKVLDVAFLAEDNLAEE